MYLFLILYLNVLICRVKNLLLVTVYKIMKLDTSGLESTAPLFGSSSSELLDEISAAPSFALPNTINVSSNVVLLFSLISYSHERKVEVLLAEY